MPHGLRTITKKTLIAGNILVAFFYLLAILAPVVNPKNAWYISVLGLAFPVFLLLLLFFLIFWLAFKSKWSWFSLMVLLAGYKSIRVSFGLHIPTTFVTEKKSGTLRIASWNVARFLEWKRNDNEKSRVRLKILNEIKRQDADILCLQEFFHSPDPQFYNNIRELKTMGYPFYYFSYDPDGDYQYIGSAIFSKYPILDTGLVRYFRPSMPEALIHADIKVNDDTLRVFTTHLQSVQFRKKDYDALHEIARAEDSFFVNSKTVLAKLKKAIRYRSTQADVVRNILDDSPYPVIFCGDLNDVPNSYTYFTIRGAMQDAFLEKGSGLGRTFVSLSPTLRIDYILADKVFRIDQFARVGKNLSDHFMLVADVKIMNKKP